MDTITYAIVTLVVFVFFALTGYLVNILVREDSLNEMLKFRFLLAFDVVESAAVEDVRAFRRSADMSRVYDTIHKIATQVVSELEIPLRNVRVNLYITPTYIVVTIGDGRILLNGGSLADVDVYMAHVSTSGELTEVVRNSRNILVECSTDG